jgi:hypothetical protein
MPVHIAVNTILSTRVDNEEVAAVHIMGEKE